MRKVLILLVLLFAIGAGALAPSSRAQGGDRHNPCVKRCREEFKSAREACRHLPPGERRECERRARERFEACVRSCR
jgi:hypothetical protein